MFVVVSIGTGILKKANRKIVPKKNVTFIDYRLTHSLIKIELSLELACIKCEDSHIHTELVLPGDLM